MRRLLILALVLLGSRAVSATEVVSFGTLGTGSASTTSASMPLPASLAAGDMLIACVSNKYPAVDPSMAGAQSAWTALTGAQASGESGSSGEDTGGAQIKVFYRIADGTESGNQAVTNTSGSVIIGYIIRYTKPSGTWDIAGTSGSDSTPGTEWSVTGAGDPGVAGNDMVVTCTAQNTDAYTHTSEALTQTGVTFGTMTERVEQPSSNGDDMRLVIADFAVSSGTSGGAPVFTMTSSGSATDAPAGATAIVRLRAISASGRRDGTLMGVGR